MDPGCAAVSFLYKAQGSMLCPSWAETGPFEPSAFYRSIVRLQQRPCPLMSQHSRERINELVLGQMSNIVHAGNSGLKGTSVAVRLCRHTRRHSSGHLLIFHV